MHQLWGPLTGRSCFHKSTLIKNTSSFLDWKRSKEENFVDLQLAWNQYVQPFGDCEECNAYFGPINCCKTSHKNDIGKNMFWCLFTRKVVLFNEISLLEQVCGRKQILQDDKSAISVFLRLGWCHASNPLALVYSEMRVSGNMSESVQIYQVHTFPTPPSAPSLSAPRDHSRQRRLF